MDAPTPTMDEWRALYEAALAFKEQAPWEWMFEDQVFGIRNPETGDIGYASVMGQLGEHLALGLYLGVEGLWGFYRLSDEEEPEGPDFLVEVPHLQASFQDREVLTDKDRQVIKSLGLRFRGRQEWPWFRSYRPGYMPWYLTPDEARFLTVALQQALGVALRLKETPSLLEPPQPELLMVRTLGDEGWVDGWAEPGSLRVHLPSLLREDTAAALRQGLARQPWSLEVDLYGLTGIRNEEGRRPYLGYHLMIVESTSGFILGGQMLTAEPSFEDMWVDAPRHLVDALLRLKALPTEIVVRREKLQYYLEPVAEQLGIQVRLAERLPVLDPLRREFEQRM